MVRLGFSLCFSCHHTAAASSRQHLGTSLKHYLLLLQRQAPGALGLSPPSAIYHQKPTGGLCQLPGTGLSGARRVFPKSGLGTPHQKEVTFAHKRPGNPSVGECAGSALWTPEALQPLSGMSVLLTQAGVWGGGCASASLWPRMHSADPHLQLKSCVNPVSVKAVPREASEAMLRTTEPVCKPEACPSASCTKLPGRQPAAFLAFATRGQETLGRSGQLEV